ncbi:MAG TPA: flagellar biosynthetic protein FliR [Rhodocyclaceae bacterium]|nr:flagellar biosynthetic protein FliR [Rhodocyclaceae bacterium]
MLSITSAQVDAFLVLYAFPLARVLALMSTAPVFNDLGVPRRIRLVIGIAITVAIAQVLPASTMVEPGSYVGIATFIQQILIGTGMGMSMRVVFSALDVAGSIIGLEMGLSFATFFDPQSQGQTSVVAQLMTLLATLIFLALNGHLLLLDVLVRSFEWLPISSHVLAAKGWQVLVHGGGIMFAAGLLISLPIVAALLITNIALGILTRSAPQLNLFSLGFPITSTVGIVLLLVSLNAFAPALQNLFDQGFDLLAMVIKAWAG